MVNIKAAIELLLKDKFSPGIKGAAAEIKKFGEKTVSVANNVNNAFSGLGAQIASLGVTIGAAALAKSSIDYEDSLVRIGTNAGMSAAETNQLRRELIKIAQDTKISNDEMVSYAATLADNSIGFETIKESANFAALAIQGLGLSGQEAADLFSVLNSRGADVDTFKTKLNNLAEIDDRMQGMGLAEFTRYIPQLMELSDTPIENLEDLYTTILTLNKGAKNTKAIQQYQSAMQDFANPETRDAMRKYLNGFDTKQNGKLKDFTVIMNALVKKGNELGNFDQLQKAFHLSDATIMALKQYNNHYQETIDKVGDLGDTHDAVSSRASANMKTMKSALTGLQNAIMAQSDGALIKPLETITRLLNENPKGLEMAIKGVKYTLIGLTALKAFSSVVSFLSNWKNLKGGKAGAGITGGAGIPVHVTNAGSLGGLNAGKTPNGMPAGTPLAKGTPFNNAQKAVANLTPKHYAAGGAAMGITAAFTAIPAMVNELDAIKQNEELTNKERGKAKGGAIGDATGRIVGGVAGGIGGVAAGAAAGAAIGTIIPGIGNIVGALVGAGVGALGMWLGSKAGRAIGEGIGEGLAKDEPLVREQQTVVTDDFAAYNPQLPEAYFREMQSLPRLAETTKSVNVEGEIKLQSQLIIEDSGYRLRQSVVQNTTPFKFPTGNTFEAWLTP
ncbi:MAG: hypothetical protein LBV17_09360 [Treponema sp.]|jgi:hypothetical protein|nr:hypothetical protein [Treponema sp.]